MQLSGKKIIVVGLGKTGLSTTRFLTERGAQVTVTDSADRSQLKDIVPRIEKMGARLELGRHNPQTFENADLIVLSPGVPHTLKPIQAARVRGVEVIGEIELASRFIKEPIAAVTGTNGKTTTTELLAAMLTQSGLKVYMGGNIGNPLIDYVDQDDRADIVVLEVSSFQLDTIVHFKPDVALLLNISEDHLDRYPNFNAYVQSKGAIIKNQGPDEIAILNHDDPEVVNLSKNIRSRVLFFNASSEDQYGAVIRPNEITFKMDPDTWLSLELSSVPLTSRHNLENAAAAGLATLAAGGNINGIGVALKRFEVPAHRLAYVTTKNDIRFFDDSKATNVDAVKRALETFENRVILIMGGRDKGGDYSVLGDMIQSKVKALILIGEARAKIRASLGHLTFTQDADSMENAVKQAFEKAEPGDTVLLSPACASFDMFDSYGHRGRVFQEAVQKLTE